MGCLNPFAPKLGEISSNLDIFLTPQKTPEEVMTNFRYAYILKDSLVYRNLLNDDFIFVWRDHENDTFVSWGKEDDIRTTVGLFNAFTVINLVWNSTNYITYSKDSTTAEISKGFILTLDSELRITGDALFNLIKLPESGIWKITRWVDKSII
ncbi:hypothetical protein AMJ80_09660 [bacterium SM23_31]|nr:MAG: hypothetical protein AMJ80_09660 [bacterium SM23_31]